MNFLRAISLRINFFTLLSELLFEETEFKYITCFILERNQPIHLTCNVAVCSCWRYASRRAPVKFIALPEFTSERIS